MKKTRRAARELALNVLYQVDAAGLPFQEALDTALESVDLTEMEQKQPEQAAEVREYAVALTQGVRDNLDGINSLIKLFSKDWALDRQPAVDRNILRIAMYEMAHVDEVPELVSINEAVELAKKFSTDESGKFVNGVLAGYLRRLKQEDTNGSSDS
jgi:transcription antitermination protein NusB